MDWVSWFLMLLPITKDKMTKARADIGVLVKNSFKADRFKRIEFQDKGLNENTILGKLKSWYFYFILIFIYSYNFIK